MGLISETLSVVAGSWPLLVLLWIFYSVAYALIFKFSARFVLQDAVTLESCLLSGVVGVLLQFVLGMVLYVAMSLMDGQTALVVPPAVFPIAVLVLGLLSGAAASHMLMRRSNGARLSFAEASRMQLAPTFVWIVLGAVYVAAIQPPAY